MQKIILYSKLNQRRLNNMPKRKNNRYDDYINKRTWLTDTTETAEDRVETAREVKKLDRAMNWASRSSAGLQGRAGKAVNKVYKTY